MRFPFVSRKKYETEKENCKIVNALREEVCNKNIELQKKVKELNEYINSLELQICSYNSLKTEKTKTTKKPSTKRKNTKKEVK